ncbi:lipoate--protein ligase family protein [Thiomicrolovo sp. ZZH C-3]
MHEPITWRLLENGRGSAGANMALDEALLQGSNTHELPVLRLYGWEPSLTFGRFQHPDEHIDLHEARRQGIACVRRMTGGGVMAHGGDLSYALVLPQDRAHMGGVKQNYRRLCGFLLRFYEMLGLDAAFAAERGGPLSPSPVCAAGHEAYDIVIGGRKIGGNAQRYANGALLQHGSIPLRMDAERFDALLRNASLKRTATLESFGVAADFDNVSGALKTAFCDAFGTELLPAETPRYVRELAGVLESTKYARDAWNHDVLRT